VSGHAHARPILRCFKPAHLAQPRWPGICDVVHTLEHLEGVVEHGPELATVGDVQQCYWLVEETKLLQELHAPLTKSTLMYCDNVNIVYLSTNLIQHQRMKHVEIDLHFVWERVSISDVYVLHMSTTSQFADIFTKDLPTSVFSEFRSSLNIHCGYSFDCRGGVETCYIIGTWVRDHLLRKV
jgi:hypothetical protein